MTALVVASNGQEINTTLDATGCDIGIYVGPGVTGVTIYGTLITNASSNAILVQDTRDVTIKHNVVRNNDPNGQFDAVQVTGSSHIIILSNTVVNNGAGGIGLSDDGDHQGNNNIIAENTVSSNAFGNGIVVSSMSAGQGVANNLIMGNLVYNNHGFGIAVLAEAPNGSADYNRVIANVSIGNQLAGVAVESLEPGAVVSNNSVSFNRISGNGSAGVVLAASKGGSLTNTLISHNRISNEMFFWEQSGDTGTVFVGNTTD